MKSEKIEIGDKLCSCQLLEHNLKQEITVLRSQIVSDPTKLLELVEEMRILIEKKKESIRSIDRNIYEAEGRLNRLNKIEDQIKLIHKVCSEIYNTDESIEKHEQSIVISERKLKNWDSNINALKIRINHIERQISHLESKIYNLQSKDKKVSEEITGKINNLKEKYDSVNSERIQMLEKVQNNNNFIQELMFEKAKVVGEYERECSDLSSILISLNGQIDSHFNELKNML